jgi:hypothetical protein
MAFFLASYFHCSLIALPEKYSDPWQTVVWPWALTEPKN